VLRTTHQFDALSDNQLFDWLSLELIKLKDQTDPHASERMVCVIIYIFSAWVGRKSPRPVTSERVATWTDAMMRHGFSPADGLKLRSLELTVHRIRVQADKARKDELP
jgi:hypothetical protein